MGDGSDLFVCWYGLWAKVVNDVFLGVGCAVMFNFVVEFVVGAFICWLGDGEGVFDIVVVCVVD